MTKNNVSDLISDIRSYDHHYSIIYDTGTHVLFCSDYFGTKELWYYYNYFDRVLTFGKTKDSWRAIGNKIYVVDKDTWELSIHRNITWDLQQTVDNENHLISCFEEAVGNDLPKSEVGKTSLYKDWYFPEDLRTIFPYHTYGASKDIKLEEQIMRANTDNIDITFPFLKRKVYQSWLNTTQEIKNKKGWVNSVRLFL